MRIIGGKWRSRRISISDNASLRPSPDRVRETVFNWLTPFIIEAHCLDLFAGTGVLGFEALSRGASSVTFIEKDLKTLQQLKACAQEFKTNDATFYLQDALKWLEQPATQTFNIIFLDPPFRKDLISHAIHLLQQNNWLAPGALLYIEMERDLELALPAGWHWRKQQYTQQISYGLVEAGIKE